MLRESWDGVQWAQPRPRAVLRAVQLVRRSTEELERNRIQITYAILPLAFKAC